VILIPLALLVVAACFCTVPDTDRPPLVISPDQLPEAQVGEPYSVTITVSDNETPVYYIAISDGDLPPGLTLTYQENESMAEISGTPEQVGEFTFTIIAACLGTNISGQGGTWEYTIVVK
jgi:hypothetical protein